MQHFFMCMVLCIFLNSGLHAKNTNQHKKQYIDQNTVLIENGKIFIVKEGNPIQVKILRSDKKGIFIFDHDIGNTRDKGGHYYCEGCKHWFCSKHAWNNHSCNKKH